MLVMVTRLAPNELSMSTTILTYLQGGVMSIMKTRVRWSDNYRVLHDNLLLVRRLALLPSSTVSRFNHFATITAQSDSFN